jgi:hypothetical protein
VKILIGFIHIKIGSSLMKVKCFKRLFPDADERRKVNVEFTTSQMEEKVLLTLILWMIGVRWTQNLGG